MNSGDDISAHPSLSFPLLYVFSNYNSGDDISFPVFCIEKIGWHLRLDDGWWMTDLDDITMQCCSRVTSSRFIIHRPSRSTYILVCLFWPQVMSCPSVVDNALKLQGIVHHWSIRSLHTFAASLQVATFHCMSCVSLLIASIHTQYIRMSRCDVSFQTCFCDIKNFVFVRYTHPDWVDWTGGDRQAKKFKLTSEDLEDLELQMTARCRTWSLWLFCPGFTNVASFSKSC